MDNISSHRVSTGSFDIDKWLKGGYERDVITMIAGPPGSGKTNMCMLAACSQAKNGSKVIFMDTEGGFSTERVNQIAGEYSEEVMKNIFLLNPTNFEEQNSHFLNLFKNLKKEQVSMIVIDGVAMLYRIEIGEALTSKDEEKVKKINMAIAGYMRMLSEISRKQKIPIILSNQVYGNFLSEEDWKKGVQKKMSIVGGDLFKYWCKCIIELKKEGVRRKAILSKHRSIPQTEINFEIKDNGIFKKGWI